MDFPETLKQWSATRIAQALGCPERTVYAWKMGERQPPDWVQPLILERLKHIKPDHAPAGRQRAGKE